jgi:hypothetical protein
LEFLIKFIFSVLYVFAAEDPLLSHVAFEQFKNCEVNKEMIYLSKEQKQDIAQVGDLKNFPGIVKSYKILCPKEEARLYLMSDQVRTHYQNGFVVVSQNKIKDIHIVEFKEPQKYRASRAFLKRFFQKNKFTDVDGLTGATLTRSSLVRMSKMALKLDQVK